MADHTRLYVADDPDEDGTYLLFFLASGATVKCGYIFADAVDEVRDLLIGEASDG